jgi:predicted RNase H-like HicB family nuclease
MFRKKTAPKNVYFNETKPVYNVIAVPDYGQTGWWCLTCREVQGAISQARNLDEALENMQEVIHVLTTKKDVKEIDFKKIPPSQIIMYVQSWVPTEQKLDEMDAANEL